MVTFLRRDVHQYAKFGWGRGKKAKWRAPKGIHNKMREKIKGHPVSVSIGYGTDNKVKGLMNEKKPVTVMNVKDLEKIQKNEIGLIGKVGQKKKIEIAKKAVELKVELKNLNAKTFLKKLNKQENKK